MFSLPHRVLTLIVLNHATNSLMADTGEAELLWIQLAQTLASQEFSAVLVSEDKAKGA